MSADRTSPTGTRPRCQPLYAVYGLVALLAGTGVLLQLPVMFLFALMLARQVPRMVNGRTWASPRAREQAVGEAAPLPRQAWVVTTVLLETVLFVSDFVILAVLLLGHGDVLLPRGRSSDYLMLGGVVLVIAAHDHAHRKSAHPAGPARTGTQPS